MSNVKQIEYLNLFSSGDEFGMTGMNTDSIIKSTTPYTVKKIQLFTRVLDLHVMTDLTDIYTTPWSL